MRASPIGSLNSPCPREGELSREVEGRTNAVLTLLWDFRCSRSESRGTGTEARSTSCRRSGL